MPKVGPYETLEVLGRGGQGLVARARDVRTGAIVALKVVLDDLDPTARARLEREARALSGLDHPNLARYVDHGTHDGRPWLALAYVQGKTLEALRRAGSPAPPWSARVVADVARALARCHAAGLVHRDVKPANIIVEEVTGRPVLVDFGLVRRGPRPIESQGEPLTLSGELVGTPAFMAPEQADPRGELGPVGPWTDVHALGATLHFLLTGKPPFAGATLVQLLAQLLEQPPRPPSATAPGVSAALDALVLRALAKRPAERPTAEELARALEAVASGDAGGPAAAPPASRPRRRQRAWTAVAAAIALPLGAAAAVALALAARRERPGEAPPPPPEATTGVVPAAPAPRAPPWPASPDAPGGWRWRRADGPVEAWAPALWEAEDVAAPAALAGAGDTAAVRAAFGDAARPAGGGRVIVRYLAPGVTPPGVSVVRTVVGQAGLFTRQPPVTTNAEEVRLAADNDTGVTRLDLGRAVWDAPAVRCEARAGRHVDRDFFGLTARPDHGAAAALSLEGRAGVTYLRGDGGQNLQAVAGLGPEWGRLWFAPGGPPGERLVLGSAPREAVARLAAALAAPAQGAQVGLVLDEVEVFVRDLEVEGTPRTVDWPALAGPAATSPPGRVALAFARAPGATRGGPLVALEDAAGRRVTLSLDGERLVLSRQDGPHTELLATAALGPEAEGWLWLEGGGGVLLGRARVGDREVEVAAADPWCGPWVRAGWGSTGPRVRVRDAEVGGPPAADPPGAAAWRRAAQALARLACPRRLDVGLLPPPGDKRLRALAEQARAAAAELEEAEAAGLGGAGGLVRRDALARAALGRAIAGDRSEVERLTGDLLADGAPAARRALAALGPASEEGGQDLVEQLVVGWSSSAPDPVQRAFLALALAVAPERRGDVLTHEGLCEQLRFNATGDAGAREDALRLYADARAAGGEPRIVLPREAELLYLAGRLDEALERYDEAVRLEPRLWAVWLGRAQVLRALGRHELCLASLLGALAGNRNHPPLFEELTHAADGASITPGVRTAALWALAATRGTPAEVAALEREADQLLSSRLLPARDLDLLAFVLGAAPPGGDRPTATLARARQGDVAARAALGDVTATDELVRNLARLTPGLAPLVR